MLMSSEVFDDFSGDFELNKSAEKAESEKFSYNNATIRWFVRRELSCFDGAYDAFFDEVYGEVMNNMQGNIQNFAPERDWPLMTYFVCSIRYRVYRFLPKRIKRAEGG